MILSYYLLVATRWSVVCRRLLYSISKLLYGLCDYVMQVNKKTYFKYLKYLLVGFKKEDTHII